MEKILSGPAISNYKGSAKTAADVAEQIRQRWGEEEVKNYNPFTNALTFAQWIRLGFKVKKGQKALRSITFVEKKDAQGNVIKKFPRKINLFYYLSVEPITN